MKTCSFGHSGTKNPEITDREVRNQAAARKAAGEGIVLLKNDGSILPLKAGSAIGLFGSGAAHTVKGGTGSGDVNERRSVTIYQGLLNAGFDIVSKDWIENYEKIYINARKKWKNEILDRFDGGNTDNFFNIYSSTPFKIPDGRPVCGKDVGSVKTAIYCISRISGENADRKAEKGDYYPSDRELEDLRTLDALGKNIILVLNAGGQIDLKDILTIRRVHAVLMIAQPGMEGGDALADILTGTISPSGKLTDTWAENFYDFPNANTFSHQNGDLATEKYEDSIFVGYRYFDSFDIPVQFPFGYGLSYTSFKVQTQKIITDNNSVQVIVTVQNTGSRFAGKEVVQVYASCPQNKLPKEYRRLCAFAKTDLLHPGEKETLKISFPARALASFSEEKSSWIIESGWYGLWTGTSSKQLTLSGILSVEKDCILERVGHICPVRENLQEIVLPKEPILKKEKTWHEFAVNKGFKPIRFQPKEKEQPIHREDQYDRMAKETVSKLAVSQMIPMVIGGETGSTLQGALGATGKRVPGSSGETNSSLADLNIASVTMADGPAGIRILQKYEVDRATDKAYNPGMIGGIEGGYFTQDVSHKNTDTYYQYCTAFPTGTLLAQSWNLDLMKEVGKAVASEMDEFHINLWLAPGLNIHRNPLCGRNFEYYSEDPVLSGLMAASITQGVQSKYGVGTTVKHFACNNQEDNRMGVDCVVSERALREIYLKGFEIAVKISHPMAIMSSYNKINGVHSANNPDLCTAVARKEWGFGGIIMTDWATTSPAGGSIPWKCIAAGNDLIMPGCNGDLDNIQKAYKSGKLRKEDLSASVERLLNMIYRIMT